MRYADVIWCGLLNSKSESLQRLQDRAVSMIQKSRIKDNWTPKFLAVEQLIKFVKVGIEQKLLRKRKTIYCLQNKQRNKEIVYL